MALNYGFLKGKINSDTALKSSRRPHELQYHLHTTVQATGADGDPAPWDTAINVGTTDSDDFGHPPRSCGRIYRTNRNHRDPGSRLSPQRPPWQHRHLAAQRCHGRF
jgi:hypothetical protein